MRLNKIFTILFVLLSVISCKSNSPSGSNSTLLRTGETSADRSFSVVLEDTNTCSMRLWLQIDGEEALFISETPNYYGDDFVRSALILVADSLQVFEYAGTVDLVHVDWRDTNLSDIRSYTYYNYYIAAQGHLSEALLTGRKTSSGTGHYAFNWGSGHYGVNYIGNILHITEHQRAGQEGTTCYLEETILDRSYRVSLGNPALIELFSCDEQYRAAQLSSWSNLCMSDPNLEIAIQQAPWATANFSPEDVIKKCSALQ